MGHLREVFLHVMHSGPFEGSFLRVMHSGPFEGSFLRVMHGTDGRHFFSVYVKIYIPRIFYPLPSPMHII